MRVRVTAINDNTNAVNSQCLSFSKLLPAVSRAGCVTGTQETTEQAARDMENL